MTNGEVWKGVIQGAQIESRPGGQGLASGLEAQTGLDITLPSWSCDLLGSWVSSSSPQQVSKMEWYEKNCKCTFRTRYAYVWKL